MKNLTLLALPFLLPIGIAAASDMEYGKPSELAGVTRIFVDTDGNLELRNNIVSEILDDLEAPYYLTIVERINEAEVVLLVSSITNRRGNPYTEITAMRVPDNAAGSLRVLWQWGDENTSRFGRRPSSRAADRFVAEWKKFNKEQRAPKPITRDLAGVTKVCLVFGDLKRATVEADNLELMDAVQSVFDEQLGAGVLRVVFCGREEVLLDFQVKDGEGVGLVERRLSPRCHDDSCVLRVFDFQGSVQEFIKSFVKRFQADNPR